jgi:hypothetical protein
MTDADDEMMIEVSCSALPPLSPEAPSVADRLRTVIESSEHAGEASPVTTSERGEVRFAWSEYCFASHDSKKPKGRKRKARGRWWEKDVATAEAAWDALVASIRLSGRVRENVEPRARG